MSGAGAGNAAGTCPVGEGVATHMDGVDLAAGDAGGEALFLQSVRTCGVEGQDFAALLGNADAQSLGEIARLYAQTSESEH